MNNIFKTKFPLLDSLICFKGNNWGKDHNEPQKKKLYDEYLKLVSSKKDIVRNITTYFGGHLHDSWVTSVSYKKNQIEIFLNDFTSHCFADAICEEFHLSVPHKKRVLPVVLTFTGIKNCSISWINGNSKIIPLKKERVLPKISEFLFDEIINLRKNQIEIGLLFWSGLKGNKSELLLQIECESIAIIESQRKAFETIFKGEYLKLFDAYWEQKQKGKNIDFATAQKLIKEKT